MPPESREGHLAIPAIYDLASPMLSSRGEEDANMSATGRILAGIVVAVFLLSLAVLEVVSERIASSAYLGDAEMGSRTERIVMLQNGRTGEANLEQ